MNKNAERANRYNKANTKSYLLRLNKNTEPELIEFMKTVKNKNGFFKKLIREELNNSKGR